RRVSILARPEGRAPRAGGLDLRPPVEVSILARPEGRAPRPPRCRGPARSSCFNPRPTRRPGATWTSRAAVPYSKSFLGVVLDGAPVFSLFAVCIPASGERRRVLRVESNCLRVGADRPSVPPQLRVG